MLTAATTLPLIFAASPASVAGETSAPRPEPQADEIVITGQPWPLTLNAKELARAVKAHRKLRAVYAPQSQLSFEVLRGSGSRSLDGIKLTFRSKNEVVPVVLDANRRFTLPALPGKGWKLVANRRGGFGILPLVMSPGTNDADRLLGDLRLQCEVGWAMAKPDLPIMMRAFAGAMGGVCKGSLVPFMIWSDRAIATASVSSGARTRPVDVTTDRHAYRPPLHDKTLPNSARVRFRYE